jgi:hypothetical protein
MSMTAPAFHQRGPRRWTARGFLGLLAALSMLGACGDDRSLPRVAPSWFETIRTYGWDSRVDDPEASWSPDGDEILARRAQGFVVYQEGDPSRQRTEFRSEEGRESGHPQWVNAGEVVFGPLTNADKLADGRVVVAGGGVVVVDISGERPRKHQLCDSGYRPRVGKGQIIVQVEDRMISYDPLGNALELGHGFFAEPRRDDSGAWCYQVTPVSEPDYWTGRPVRSPLVVNWGDGHVDLVPGGTQARWTRDGGLLLTVLRSEPPPDGPWTAGGTDVMWIPRHGQAPRLVQADASDGDPNPAYAVVAATSADGHVLIVARDGSARIDLGPGRHPQWNHDGTRLLIEQSPEDLPAELPSDQAGPPAGLGRHRRIPAKPGQHLTVYVFRIGPPQ